MSGHSKWSQIKRQKGVTDSRRGQLFTKLSREIEAAVRQGGESPEMNFRLRLAIQKARDSNMPIDNIERAIKRAAGGTEGANLIEATYEGYGPGGVAILLETLSDNRNRTISEIRNVLSRGGGNLGESGCVTWIFEPKGVITVTAGDADEEELTLFIIDAGAEDIKVIDGSLEVHTKPEDLEGLRRALEQRELAIVSAEVLKVPKSVVMLDEKAALQALRLLDKLEELDDVQRVFTNADFPDEALERYRSQG
ncbi:MAG: YebC/PmpR family DNA-binding transcriptional regulator [Dehalococcoidia bacterium]|nr:YebC/PmpR family DNA-binding transcriptional regulator [Dehalococcoidia bacterium]